jgi:hypothetical protein
LSQTEERSNGIGRLARDVGPTVLVVAAVWLGWQVVRELVAERLPVHLAIQVSPASASVLTRGADAELVAKRYDNAETLAREALGRAPFSAASLRVLGLVTAEKGDEARADQLLTLAGNWSLRDDPAHAWLMVHRLKRGDYNSAFAHADTLARRRPDMRPRLFEFFRMAATHDLRAMRSLIILLAAKPPWRREFLDDLNTSVEGLGLSAALAIGATGSKGPYSDAELAALYSGLLSKGRLAAMAEVRRRTSPGGATPMLVNGDFDAPSRQVPFDWLYRSAAGVVVEILPDELRGDVALRAQHGSFDIQPLAYQMVQLKPGRYRFSGQARVESGEAGDRLTWAVTCLESAQVLTPRIRLSGEAWRPFAAEFSVPAENCTAQWVRLEPLPSHRRATVVAWYDRLAITSINGPEQVRPQ